MPQRRLTCSWQVELKGDARDLAFLRTVLSTGPQRVLADGREAQAFVYESDSFAACTTHTEVGTIASREVGVLSGILRLDRGAREGLHIGGIYRLQPNGGREIFESQGEAAEARDDQDAALVSSAGGDGGIEQPRPRTETLVRLASSDRTIEKVLRLWGAADAGSWVGMYRGYEVIEKDVGGEHSLKKVGWLSATQLKRFKQSANSPHVGGDEARHGSDRPAPEHPMTATEADAFVTLLTHAWLATKVA